LKKIFYSLLVSSLVTLSAGANDLKGSYDLRGSSSEKLNNEATLMLDCSQKTKPLWGFIGGVFNTVEFEMNKGGDSSKITSLLTNLCDNKVPKTHIKDKLYAIKYKDFLKVFNEENKESILRLNTSFKLEGDMDKNPLINEDSLRFNNSKLSLVLYDSKKDYNVLFFNVLENYDMKMLFNIVAKNHPDKKNIYSYILLEEKQEEYLLKEYKYSPEAKEIGSLKFDRPLKYEPQIYTNTYDIDETKECIDGRIWIKKYKQLSGDKCDWRKK